MTDKELLELAAKAAGIELTQGYGEPAWRCMFYQDENYECFYWNPIDDDGDALRLAVKLRIDVMTDCPNSVCIEVPVGKKDNWITECTKDDSFENVLIATRRAIVRAAAEIGRSMK